MKPRFLGAPSRCPALRMGAWSCGPPALPTAFWPLDVGWCTWTPDGRGAFPPERISSGRRVQAAARAAGRADLRAGQDWMDLPPSQDARAGVRQLSQLLLQGLELSWEPGSPAALRARPGTPPRSHRQAALSHLRAFKNHSCPNTTSGTGPQRRVLGKAGQVTVPGGVVQMSGS